MATAEDTASIGPGATFVPSSAHRNPSTTPTIGLMPYTVRQGSGRRLLGYAIGVAYIQNWVRNGTVCRTSRNCTFTAASHRPTPSEVINASRTKAGSSSARDEG